MPMFSAVVNWRRRVFHNKLLPRVHLADCRTSSVPVPVPVTAIVTVTSYCAVGGGWVSISIHSTFVEDQI